MTVTESDIEQFAQEVEKIEDGIECHCCGRRFVPIDKGDFFCKKCLKKLHTELIEKMVGIIDKLKEFVNKERLAIQEAEETITTFQEIQRPPKCAKIIEVL